MRTLAAAASTQGTAHTIHIVSLPHTTAMVTAVTCLALGIAFDWLGIGPDAVSDKFAALFVLNGMNMLMHGADPDRSVQLIRGAFDVTQSWALTMMNIIGCVLLIITVGCFLPNNSKFGRVAQRTWQSRRRVFGNRFNPKVYVLPILIGTFPATGGICGLVLTAFLTVLQIVCSWAAVAITGLV